jgi:Fur family peroxide stress response transcriptional regulator
MDAFAHACRKAGVRVTHQRTEVFRELASTTAHPSAEAVFEGVRNRIPAISRDTVYRTLAFLEEIGLVHRVDSLPGAVRYDANTDAHHHFVCTVCGAIKDFENHDLDAFTPPAEIKRWGTVERIQVQLRGRCSKCGSTKAATKNRRGKKRRSDHE